MNVSEQPLQILRDEGVRHIFEAHQAKNFAMSKLREIAGALKGDRRQWENIKAELDAFIDLQRGGGDGE